MNFILNQPSPIRLPAAIAAGEYTLEIGTRVIYPRSMGHTAGDDHRKTAILQGSNEFFEADVMEGVMANYAAPDHFLLRVTRHFCPIMPC